MALVRGTAIVLGVAVATGGTAGVITLFVVKGLTGHRLYDSTEASFRTGGVLGLGIVGLYVLTVAILEFTTTGRLEFFIVLLLVLAAGGAYVARPISEDPEHKVGRITVVAVAVLVFATVSLIALVFAYPFVHEVIDSLGSMLSTAATSLP